MNKITIDEELAAQTTFMNELKEYTKKMLSGPPKMRELTPIEDIRINKETQTKNADTDEIKIDTETRVRRKLNTMLEKDIDEAAKTVTEYQDIMERFIFLMGSTSQRIDFLRGRKLGDRRYLALIRRS